MADVTRQDVKVSMEKTQTLFTQWMAGMEAGLAEPDNPGLRHGDYGFGPAGAWIRVHGSTWWDTKDCSGPSYQDADVFLPYRTGNILDDLNAVSEPLQRFNLGRIHFQNQDGNINVDGTIYQIDQMKLASDNLRRLVATAEREHDT